VKSAEEKNQPKQQNRETQTADTVHNNNIIQNDRSSNQTTPFYHFCPCINLIRKIAFKFLAELDDHHRQLN